MTVGVLPVDAAPAVVGVDLPGAVLERIGPVLEPSLLDPAEDPVELLFADQERVVL